MLTVRGYARRGLTIMSLGGSLLLAACGPTAPDRENVFVPTADQIRMQAEYSMHKGSGGVVPMTNRSIMLEIVEERQGRSKWLSMMTDEYGYFLMPKRYQGSQVRLVEPLDDNSQSGARLTADYRKQYRERIPECFGPTKTADNGVVLMYPCE